MDGEDGFCLLLQFLCVCDQGWHKRGKEYFLHFLHCKGHALGAPSNWCVKTKQKILTNFSLYWNHMHNISFWFISKKKKNYTWTSISWLFANFQIVIHWRIETQIYSTAILKMCELECLLMFKQQFQLHWFWTLQNKSAMGTGPTQNSKYLRLWEISYKEVQTFYIDVDIFENDINHAIVSWCKGLVEDLSWIVCPCGYFHLLAWCRCAIWVGDSQLWRKEKKKTRLWKWYTNGSLWL